MSRLSSDKRFTLAFDYQGDFVPSPCKVSILDDSISVQEIAQKMYAVAGHAVTMDGKYLVGTAADADRHRR